MKLFLVDCVSSHRTSYVVRCKNEDDAKDAVTWGEVEEFSQTHLGENISRVSEITEEEYLKLFDKDNDYLTQWSNNQKMNLIHTLDYEEEPSDKYDPFLTSSITL